MINISKIRTSGEGNIRQRPDGRWEVRITLGIDFATGQSKRISKYAATREEAVKLLHQLSYIRDTRPRDFQNMTLGEWLDLCLEVYMKNSLKQSTYVSYEGYIRNHLKPSLGNVQLRDLTPRLLQQFYNYKAEAGLAPKTIVNINLFLHKALVFAVGEGYIAVNPTEMINLPHGSKPQIEILNRDEQTRLIQCSYHHRYGVFVRLVLFTGLRLGELLGLRWEDIDMQYGVLHVRRTLNRLNKVQRAANEASTEIVIQSPKSENSVRSIPLIPAVLQDLQSWRALQKQEQAEMGDRYVESGFVVTNPYGGYVEPRTFKDYYEQMLVQSGLRHFTFHALRHTFASRAMEQKMDAKTLSVILGHYSVSFTLDTYAHVLEDYKREGMALMEELFTAAPIDAQPFSYPVVMTMHESGEVELNAPDFPNVSYVGSDLQVGLQLVKDQISEEVLTAPYAMQPVATDHLQLTEGQYLLQIAV